MFRFIVILSLFTAFVSCNNKTVDKVEVPVLDSLQIEIGKVSEQIRKNPKQDDLYLKRAELHKRRGDFLAAYEDAQRAVAIDSLNSDNLLNLGVFAFAADNYYRAEAAYLKCVAVDPNNTECMARLAEFYLIRKKYNEAISYSNMALKVNTQLYRPYFIKGWALMESGDTSKAITSFQTSIELNPDFYEGFIMLGSLYTGAKKDVALEYFNSALAIKPASTEAMYFKGMHYQNSGRFIEASKEYDRIIGIDSTFSKAFYNKGYIKLTEDEQYDSAVFFFSKALQIDPSYTEAFYNRGYSYEMMGKKEFAASDYKISLSIKPDYELAQEALNRVQ